MKYIISKDGEVKLFSSTISHNTMGRPSGIESAGFCRVTDEGKVQVWGMSISLGGIKSRPEDAAIIEKVLRNL